MTRRARPHPSASQPTLAGVGDFGQSFKKAGGSSNRAGAGLGFPK